MRACMLAYTFYESDNRVRRYAQALVKRGDQVDAIALRRPGQKQYETVEGVHVYRLQKRERTEKGPFTYLARLLIFLLRSAWALTLQHLRKPYDVIHVHSVPDFEVFATLIPRIMGARIILDIHDIVPELYASKFSISKSSIVFRLLVIVERISIKYSNHVIIANHLWYERLVQRSAGREHCSTMLNYPDPAVFCRRARPARTRDEFIMFYPGTLTWHQGVDLVLGAMDRLRNQAPNLKFIVFGDGSESLRALAKEYGLEDRVVIREERPVAEVAEAMADADLGIEPKRKRSFANEAFSTKILEFMAMGVPVLASDTHVHQMYFKEGAVAYFESENIEDLASKILELMQDSAKRDALRARGTTLLQKYNWSDKKTEYLGLVDQLVKDARVARCGDRISPSS
jgi:glycosyltransferase involved in cell wall biosynthesis